MSSHPAPGSAPEFWTPREPLESAGSSSPPRRARRVTPRYAAHIGRVGALAVSLGIGFAIVNAATGVAFAAEGDSATGTSQTSDGDGGAATGGGANKPSRAESADAGSQQSSDDGAEDDDAVDAEDGLGGEDETGSGGGANADTGGDTDGDEEEPADDEQLDEAEVPLDEADEDPVSKETGTQDQPAVEVRTVSARKPASPQVTPHTGAPAAQEVVSLNAAAVVTSNVVAPLVDPAVPVPNPVADGILAWVRRLIVHTFFNKTPVVRSIETEQILTGQVIITVDAYDPNGDPLTYEIVQPEGGLVLREPLTGVFVYTPTTPVIGGAVPVDFDIVIRDDSEHLTGFPGVIQRVLHSIARFFRLAQPDNFTQAVDFDVYPILQIPPTAVVVGGLPYLLGSDPVKLLSVAEITDLDSPAMKAATLTIGLGRTAGDKLTYQPPPGVAIGVEQVNDWTLKLTGVASQADYESVLKAVTFSATQIGLLARTVEITLTDQHDVSSLVPALATAVVLPGVKVPPIVLPVNGLPFALGGDPVKLLSIAEITDVDSASLKAATVAVTVGRSPGDKLGYVPPAGSTIQASWTNDWTLKLSGLASKADYENALKAVTFSATEIGLIVRTVEITLTDDDDVNSLAPALVAATVLPGIPVELPLTVTPVGAPIHTIGKAPVKLVSSVVIANADDGKLSGAVVAIGLNRATGDKLGFTPIAGNPITVAQTNDWTVTLSGAATVDQYQEVLKSITFSATQLGLPRSVTINVTEADGDTTLVPGVVFANSIAALPPTVATVGLSTLAFPNVGETVKPITVATIVDTDSALLTAASVKITDKFTTGDTLGYSPIAGVPITATYNSGSGELKLSGSATILQYKQALESITFKATNYGGSLTDLLGVTRTLSVYVTDDSTLTNAVPGVVAVTVFRSVVPLA